MLKSYKKKLAIRKYREREQPQWRKKKGFLEKKVDYQRRAKIYNQKKEMLKNLKEKAELKNPQEFYFRMENAQMNVFQQEQRRSYFLRQIRRFKRQRTIPKNIKNQKSEHCQIEFIKIKFVKKKKEFRK